MRSNVADYQLQSASSLTEVLQRLAQSPGALTPLAGGTELMVALGAGRLQTRNLISLWGIAELRFISVTDEMLTIGSGTTFSDIRKSATIAAEFPLLAQAASWTGSIANQNRGTLGGNIANASPAADSPPALLAYDAEIDLVSVRGVRSMTYRDFHLAYKKTQLASDELVQCVRLRRAFSGYAHYARKVGTRNAQAISKVAIAALARMKDGVVEDIRIGAASLREVPIRCLATESALRARPVTDETIALARKALAGETLPIDDIRSTAKYRSAVASNLLEDFLRSLV